MDPQEVQGARDGGEAFPENQASNIEHYRCWWRDICHGDRDRQCSDRSLSPMSPFWQAHCVILAAGQRPFMGVRNRPMAEVADVN